MGNVMIHCKALNCDLALDVCIRRVIGPETNKDYRKISDEQYGAFEYCKKCPQGRANVNKQIKIQKMIVRTFSSARKNQIKICAEKYEEHKALLRRLDPGSVL